MSGLGSDRGADTLHELVPTQEDLCCKMIYDVYPFRNILGN